jgi:hypothetical protein
MDERRKKNIVFPTTVQHCPQHTGCGQLEAACDDDDDDDDDDEEEEEVVVVEEAKVEVEGEKIIIMMGLKTHGNRDIHTTYIYIYT